MRPVCLVAAAFSLIAGAAHAAPDRCRVLDTTFTLGGDVPSAAQSLIADCTALIDGKGETDATLAIAHVNRGAAHAALGEDAPARADFMAAVTLDANDADAYAGLGFAYNHRAEREIAKPQFTRAIALYDNALTQKPGDPDLLFARGRALGGARDNDASLADLEAASRARPDFAPALTFLGLSYEIAGKRDRTFDLCDKAVRLLPDYSIALACRGMMYAVQGKSDLALVDYDHALRSNPLDASNLLARGLIHDGRKEIDAAVADYTVALRQMPESAEPEAAHCGSAAPFKANAFAIAADNRVLERDPACTAATANRCRVRALLGVQLDGALADCDAAIAAAAERGLLFSRGLIYLRLHRDAEALRDEEQVVAADPSVAAALYARGVARLRTGDKAGGEADIAAAQTKEADVADESAAIGIRP